MFAAKAVSAAKKRTSEHQMMIPSMPLQYMVHMARVKVHLPATGDCWFFISPQLSVKDFLTEIKEEDNQIETLEILAGKKTQQPLAETSILYNELKDRTRPIFLKVNGDMMYRFDSDKTDATQKIDLKEKSKYFQQCKDANLSNIQSSTISTILKQIETNLPFDATTNTTAATIDEPIAEETEE